MKTITKCFRLNPEDLDNIRFVRLYYAERGYNDTDVLRLALRLCRSSCAGACNDRCEIAAQRVDSTDLT